MTSEQCENLKQICSADTVRITSMGVVDLVGKVSTGFKLLVLDVIDELVCTQSSISYIMVMIWIFYSVFSDQLPSSPSIHQQIKVVS